mmetsp:Transcript_42966/g.135714  ORF Transcript_42966/g.135714 Transcript_42966/m.135714 type:complete len:148 (-) Transcript_42966:57-500(-)
MLDGKEITKTERQFLINREAAKAQAQARYHQRSNLNNVYMDNQQSEGMRGQDMMEHAHNETFDDRYHEHDEQMLGDQLEPLVEQDSAQDSYLQQEEEGQDDFVQEDDGQDDFVQDDDGQEEDGLHPLEEASGDFVPDNADGEDREEV